VHEPPSLKKYFAHAGAHLKVLIGKGEGRVLNLRLYKIYVRV
jgi:hypothetical protein